MIYENLPAEDYFSIEAASNSYLKKVRRSPAHAHDPEPEKKDTRNMEIGSALHMALLEPDLYAKTYHVAEADLRTDAFYKGLAKDLGGAVVLTRPESRRIVGMQASAYRNKRFAGYMKAAGRNELSVVTADPQTGVIIKCRFDRKLDHLPALDIKKCQDARGNEFLRAVTNYGYYMQVAFYQHVWFCETGERIDDFPLIAIEEESPHGVICHDLDEIALELGRRHFREALDTYARCLDSGIWPGYEEESEFTSVTSWAANELLSDDAFGGV